MYTFEEFSKVILCWLIKTVYYCNVYNYIVHWYITTFIMWTMLTYVNYVTMLTTFTCDYVNPVTLFCTYYVLYDKK
jgi:hypothetical protein